MTITKTDIDAQNATLTIKFEKADYEERVDKFLKAQRKKVSMPGFRPGEVPLGLVRKMYGPAALSEELLKLVNENAVQYMKDNEIELLGELLLNEQSPLLDFASQSEFEFVLDMAIAPKVELELTKKIKIPAYTVKITEEMVQERLDYLLNSRGTEDDAESVGEKDYLRVDIAQEAENGVKVEGGLLYVPLVAEKERKKLLGLKVDDVIALNIRKALTNEADCAAFLHLKKEELANIDPQVNVTIKSIRRVKQPEMNQEFFDAMFKDKDVHNENEFRAKIKAEIEARFLQESDGLFFPEARKKLLELTQLPLPEKTLKRWLQQSAKKEMLPEVFEEQVPIFFDQMRWQLITQEIGQQQDLNVTAEEVVDRVEKMVRGFYAMMGNVSVGDSDVLSAVQNMLSNEEKYEEYARQVRDEKVVNYLKTVVTMDKKEVSVEEFKELQQNSNK